MQVDTSSNGVPIPKSILKAISDLEILDSSYPPEPLQGVMCNLFSFPLFYHTHELPAFTCKLFSKNTLVNSLPLPTDQASYPLSLTFIRYTLEFNYEMHLNYPSFLYPTPPTSRRTSYGEGTWLLSSAEPNTAYPLVYFTTTDLLTICTHHSCIIIQFATADTIGFLLQSPPPGLPTLCPKGSHQIWIDTSEKCITPQQFPPNASLAPFFVPLSPSNASNHVYFLESFLSPPSNFQMVINADIPINGEFPDPPAFSTFLLKGFSPPPLLVNDCHVHDLHSVFPNVLPHLDTVSVVSITALLQDGVEVTFHTPVNAYGLLEGDNGTGERSLNLAPLEILQHETVEMKAIYDGQDWLEIMESLQKSGMEITHLPSPSEEDQEMNAEASSSAPSEEEQEVAAVETPLFAPSEQGQEIPVTAVESSKNSGSGAVGVKTGENTAREKQEKETRNQMQWDEERGYVEAPALVVRGRVTQEAQDLRVKKDIELNPSLSASTVLSHVKRRDTHQKQLKVNSVAGETPFSEISKDHKQSPGEFGALQSMDNRGSLQRERDSSIKWFKWRKDRVRPNGEMKENPYNGAGYYILGALLVLALILFFLLRRRGRRGRKGKKENASKEEFLHNNSV